MMTDSGFGNCVLVSQGRGGAGNGTAQVASASNTTAGNKSCNSKRERHAVVCAFTIPSSPCLRFIYGYRIVPLLHIRHPSISSAPPQRACRRCSYAWYLYCLSSTSCTAIQLLCKNTPLLPLDGPSEAIPFWLPYPHWLFIWLFVRLFVRMISLLLIIHFTSDSQITPQKHLSTYLYHL